MTNFHQARYYFGFLTTCKDFEVRTHKFFDTLMKPDVVKNIIGDSSAFHKFFVRPTYQFTSKEERNVSSFNSIIEYIDDSDEEIKVKDNEQAFLIGFITDEQLSTETLESIYNEIFIPVFTSISDDVIPTNRIIQDEDYIQNRRITHVGNEYMDKIHRRGINQERLIEVVAEEANETFLLYHPEYENDISEILQAKENLLKNIEKGIQLSKNIDNKKTLVHELKELKVLNFVMFANKCGIENANDAFVMLNIKTRMRVIENFME